MFIFSLRKYYLISEVLNGKRVSDDFNFLVIYYFYFYFIRFTHIKKASNE